MVLFKKKVVLFGEEQTISITPLTLLVLLGLILRIPNLFEPYWYGDEAIYLAVGQGVRQGLLLYRDIFDHKPPLIYLIAALSGSLFWFKTVLLVVNSVSIVVFWKLAVLVFKNKSKPVFLSSLIFTLLTTLPFIEGNLVNSEVLMLLPTLFSFYLVADPVKNTPRRTFLAGLVFSLSVLLKVPGIFDVFAVGFFWVISIRNRKSFIRVVKHSAALFLGIAIPIFVSVLYFAVQGALLAYWEAGWSQNFNYISRWVGGGASGQSGLVWRVVVLVGIMAVLAVLRRFFSPRVLFLCVWFVFSLFAALLSGRPYPHYLIQVVPSFCLLLGVLGFGLFRERFLPIPFFILLSVSVLYYKFYYYPTGSYYKNFISFSLGQKTKDEYLAAYDKKTLRTYSLATLIANRTGEDDRVFIWGTAPEVYALSRRVPPIKYVTSFHLVDFGNTGEALSTFQKNKPKYIVLLPEENRSFPGLSAFINTNYVYIESVDCAQVFKLINPDLARLLGK